MQFAKTLPRAHLVAWLLVIAMSLFSTLSNKVEGSTAPEAPEPPTVEAIGPIGDLPNFCTAWKTHRGSTHYFSGYTGFPHVYIDWQVRYNGCDVIKDWVTCSAATTLWTVDFTWCGFYQPTSWNKDLIHVGANWQECTVPPFPACYNNYVRQHVRNDGYMRARLYYQNEPNGGWVWTSPW
ncbi:MAG TPA: hypothetical protein VJ975_02450 [Candidatus Limnocylindria bacterium]|nr:hypothetical protein [Candidatus Limnocylindria bacterium]